MAWVNDSFTVDAGATFERGWQVFLDDGVTPYDLTGYTAKLQVRESASTTLLFEVTPTITISTGTVDSIWSAANTALMTKVLYNYALELTSSTKVIRLAEGVCNVSLEVVK